MEWARLMEMVAVRSKSQWELSDIEGVRGPSWHWDLGGPSYLISDMQDGYGIDEVVDPVTEHVHSLGEFQLALLILR